MMMIVMRIIITAIVLITVYEYLVDSVLITMLPQLVIILTTITIYYEER